MPLTNVDLDRIDGNSGLLANVSTSALNGGPLAGARNRIINGDMRIDQRNAGAAVTTTAAFPVDRFATGVSFDGTFSAQRSTVAPAGFTNSLLFTVTSADASLGASQFACTVQYIEGFNVADWGWGAAGAQTVTLSFWARSSITGTFGGALRNGAANRSYPFTYSISAANTWEYKTVTVAGDTTGTWSTDNSTGIGVIFSFGTGSTFSGTAGAWAGSNLLNATGATSILGTNGATFYITGVQLEAGTVATPFERRPIGLEALLCQRYYYKTTNGNVGTGGARTSTIANIYTKFPTQMRAAPTALEQSGVAAEYSIGYKATQTTCTSVPIFVTATAEEALSFFTSSAGVLTPGEVASGFNRFLAWSAEL